MLVALEDARVHGAEHLLGGGRDGAVAEGLERQDGEGLLDLDADLLDAEEEESDDELGRDGRPVVPRLAESSPQREGQQDEEDGEEARSEPRVHKGDRRLEDALVGAGQVDEHRDRGVEARGQLRFEVRLAQRGRHGAKAEHRSVARRHGRFDLLLGDDARFGELVQLGAQLTVVLRSSQEVAQRHGKGLGLGCHPPFEPVVLGVVGEESIALAHNVAAVVDEAAPKRARLVPPSVAGVSAEDKQQREGGHEDGEGQRG
mmetsp:Transcript_35591/g.84003  ORF Transcript_35591/g.84003 Transcript_35591/m.84003 type:complete len:259 (+) Transcript_35591:275-1051(+)